MRPCTGLVDRRRLEEWVRNQDDQRGQAAAEKGSLTLATRAASTRRRSTWSSSTPRSTYLATSSTASARRSTTTTSSTSRTGTIRPRSWRSRGPQLLRGDVHGDAGRRGSLPNRTDSIGCLLHVRGTLCPHSWALQQPLKTLGSSQTTRSVPRSLRSWRLRSTGLGRISSLAPSSLPTTIHPTPPVLGMAGAPNCLPKSTRSVRRPGLAACVSLRARSQLSTVHEDAREGWHRDPLHRLRQWGT